MRETTVARNYAEALFELGQREQRQEAFAEALEQLAELLEGDPRVRVFLESPKVEPAAKKAALTHTLSDRVPTLFLNFVLVVIDKRRQRLLLPIAREYRKLLDEHLGRLHVQVTLAHEPDERTEEDIAGELSRRLGRSVIPHVRVDSRILGGVVVRYGDLVMDGSLRRQLASMRRRMLERELDGAAAGE